MLPPGVKTLARFADRLPWVHNRAQSTVVRNPRTVWAAPIIGSAFIVIAVVGADLGETWIFGPAGLFLLWAAVRIRFVMTATDVRAVNIFSTRRARWEDIVSLKYEDGLGVLYLRLVRHDGRRVKVSAFCAAPEQSDWLQAVERLVEQRLRAAHSDAAAQQVLGEAVQESRATAAERAVNPSRHG